MRYIDMSFTKTSRIKTSRQRKSSMGGGGGVGRLRLRLLTPLLAVLIVLLNAITGTSLAAEIDTTGGEAYVDGFQVKEQHDGIGPFDDNDEAGNDSSGGNLIVRSFDSVSYMLEYTTELIDQSKPATHGASLYTEFTLPTSPDKARFDIDVMNWMLDKKLVYTYSDGTTSETKDKAKTITMQTLTGRRLLANKSNGDRVPGAGQLSVGITIKNAENGVRIKPSFKIRAAGTAIEKVCEPKSVTVSTAPRYNIEVKDNAYNTSRNIAYVDEDKGTVSIQDTSGSLQHGRIYGRSVAIALWNTSADKGLKGIEFPKGDITYDIKTTATLDGKDSTDNGGDSLLIVTSKNRVNIEVNDIKEDKTKKEIYDLDAGERTVMFKVSPAIDLISENQSTISTGNKGTAQITVTLPVGLTYKSSSIAPTSVKQNNDGTETAIFDYQNVTAGREIDSFTISCTIGYAGTDHDVKNNQQLTATAKITSSLDGKVPTKARGTIADSSIVVVRLAALSVSKFVSPAHGNLGCSHSWTLNFGNSSQTDVDNARIADIMPYVGDGRGTKFTGDYHIKKITLDLSKAPRLKASLGSEPIFYTSDVMIRKSSDDAIVNGSKLSSFKSLGVPTVNDDSLIWDNLDMTQDQLKAWRLDIPKMPGNEYISITIDVSTSNADGNLYDDSAGKKQQPDDIYANTFAEYADGQAAVVHSNVVNTTVKEADISVTKKWSGDDGHEKFRPGSVIANLSGSNGYSQGLQLSSSNNWTETVKGLAYYDENGDKITYTVSEPTVSDDYVSAVEGDSDNGFTITNTYTYNATGKIHLTAMKRITGRDFEKGDSMTFKAEESISPAGATATALSGKEVAVTPTSGNECEIDFGTVDIDSSFEGKTITYTIYEKSATGRGMSKDESKKTISFSITDPNHDHTLRVTKTTESDIPTFTNTFTPSVTTGSVTIKKMLTGRAWKSSDSFNMTIEPKTTNSITKEQAKAAMPSITLPSFTEPSSGNTSTVTISGFSFARPGIYEYEIREKIPNDAKNGAKDGIAYDTASFNVSFNVTQDKQTGNLSVTQTMKRSDKKNTDAFTNKYSAAGKFTITGIKTLTGRAMKADEFTFELLDSNGTIIDTVNNTADGKFSFKPIEVTADSNTLTYMVREKKGTAGGVTYDGHECTVTATPTDAGDGTVNGKLSYSDGSAAKFSNLYNATRMIRFSTITKKVVGRSFKDGDALTFHLTGEVTDDGNLKAPMPSNVNSSGNITIRPTSGQQANIILGTANIDSKYTGHTIRYTLTETNADAHGLSIDTSKKTFEFNITDPTLNGKLLIRENAPNDLTFTDEFTPDSITSSFTLRKQLNGREWKAGETFDVNITAKESKSITSAESATALGAETKTVSINAPQSNSGTGSVDIPLTISKPGKYIYEAVEKNAGKTKNGMTYDKRKITIAINVAQNRETDGKLYVATTTYETDSDEATDTFINGYESKGTLDGIKVTKSLVGRDWKKTDKFKFRISAGDDATSAAIYATDVTLPSNDTITVTSDGNHQSAFDKITFKKGGTYRFDITELAHGISGIDIAPKTTITVKAIDDGNGTIRCTADNTSNVTFTDYYAKNDKATVPISGKKTLSHNGYEKAPDITGKYAFALKDANGNTIETSTNDSDGNIYFSPISYTIDDLANATPTDDGTRTRTFHYTISESGNIDGVTNDTDKSFDVILTDDGNGTLTAKTANDEDGNEFSFTNIFTASATIPAITGTKTLKNAPSSDESTYSFRLSPSDNATNEAIDDRAISMPGETTYQQTECKAGEKFEFAPMTVTKPGTYSFDVSEIEPQDETVAPGVTYDKTIYTLRFTVSENGTPTMDVTPDEKNVESCDFNNKYTAKGWFSAKAHKRLNGKQLEDGEFEFELHDGNGNIISTTKNDANGNISFDEIEYGIDDIGQHRYTIVEKNGGKLGITYDSKTIAVDVSVSDNGDGTLRIDASYDEAKDEETFNNSYTPPSASDVLNDLVQTGIETLPYVISITCCIIPTIAIMRRKRK